MEEAYLFTCYCLQLCPCSIIIEQGQLITGTIIIDILSIIIEQLSTCYCLQVAELGRLQSVLMESVEEQAVVADSVLNTVLVSTDNIQEGNEQVLNLSNDKFIHHLRKLAII